MKRFLIVFLASLLVLLPAAAFAVTYDSSLSLDNKDTTTWARIADGRSATLSYGSSGPTFSFSLSAVGLEASTPYSLIYYANPYPGNNPGALLGSGTSAADGSLTITASPNLNINLPTPPDSNMVVDHSGPPDNYLHAFGAKVWLVPSLCYDLTLKKIITWSPTRFLFETDLITYTDTDITTTGVSIITTATVTEPAATIGFTVSPPTVAFGSVNVGSCSTDYSITLTNTGNVPIKLTAIPSSGFFSDCLYLATVKANVWTSTTLAPAASLIVPAKLCPTIAYSGSQTGGLDFRASFAP